MSVKKALLGKEGLLGEIYDLVLSIEHFKSGTIEAFTEKYVLDNSKVSELLANTIERVNTFEDALRSERVIMRG